MAHPVATDPARRPQRRDLEHQRVLDRRVQAQLLVSHFLAFLLFLWDTRQVKQRAAEGVADGRGRGWGGAVGQEKEGVAWRGNGSRNWAQWTGEQEKQEATEKTVALGLGGRAAAFWRLVGLSAARLDLV